jgi:hypothetical protein
MNVSSPIDKAPNILRSQSESTLTLPSLLRGSEILHQPWLPLRQMHVIRCYLCFS